MLSDPEALADIREADAAYAGGDVVREPRRPEPALVNPPRGL